MSGYVIEVEYIPTEGHRYGEIRSLYIEQLASVWMEDSEATRASVDKKIDKFVEGNLEHGAEILSALWEIMNKDGDINAPSSTPPAVSPSRVYLPPGVTRGYLLGVIRRRRSRTPPNGPQ